MVVEPHQQISGQQVLSGSFRQGKLQTLKIRDEQSLVVG
jgi:hypothetical protein